MADPISWIALQSIQALLERITVANGYHTDAGSEVSLEPFQLNEADGISSCLRVVEDDTETAGTNRESREGEMNVLVECYISVEESNAQYRAHLIRADVMKALPTRVKDLPVNIHTLDVTTRRIYQRPNGFPYVVCSVGIRVGIVETASPT